MSKYRRFGKFPLHNKMGILTAEAAYEDGYNSGLTWDRFKLLGNNYVPGGPFVHRCDNPNADSDYRAYCDATVENNTEWLRGWHNGRAVSFFQSV